MDVFGRTPHQGKRHDWSCPGGAPYGSKRETPCSEKAECICRRPHLRTSSDHHPQPPCPFSTMRSAGHSRIRELSDVLESAGDEISTSVVIISARRVDVEIQKQIDVPIQTIFQKYKLTD
jgi:hypothetical protein